MRTRNRRLGPLVQHPPPPLPGRHHTTTSRKSTHNNTKGSGLNKPPQNPGFDTPAKGHCTRYVALHPLRGAAPVTSRCTRYVALHPLRGATPVTRRNTRSEGVHCLRIGCSTPSHKNKRGSCETRTWVRCRWVAAGPGRASRRRAERSSQRGRLAGGPPPTGTPSSPAHTNKQHGTQKSGAATSIATSTPQRRPRPVSRPRPRRAQSAPLSAAQPSGTAEQAPPIRRSCPRDPRPRRGRPRGGRRGHGTGSRTRSPGPRRGRSGSTAGRHRAHHTRRA